MRISDGVQTCALPISAVPGRQGGPREQQSFARLPRQRRDHGLVLVGGGGRQGGGDPRLHWNNNAWKNPALLHRVSVAGTTPAGGAPPDRKSAVQGKRWAAGVDMVGGRQIKKKNTVRSENIHTTTH